MSNISPKISIIVPIYKAENYLHRCIDSLLAQTFTDFEILLIDDGSPDKSGTICDEYAQEDKRIRVFHKENGGVSSARQYGINHALGEYTIHADPDDWVEPNMLECLYSKAIEEDADMVICDYFLNYRNKQIYKKQEPSKLDHKTVFRELFQQLHCSCWNKLIKLACYNNYNIEFPKEMSLGEDGYVMYNLTMHPIKITYLPKSFYHYDQYSNGNSLTKEPSSRDLNSIIFLISHLEKKLDPTLFSYEIFSRKCIAKYTAFRSNITYKEFKDLYSEINRNFILNYKNIEGLKKNRPYYIIAVCLDNMDIISSFIRNGCSLLYSVRSKIKSIFK